MQLSPHRPQDRDELGAEQGRGGVPLCLWCPGRQNHPLCAPPQCEVPPDSSSAEFESQIIRVLPGKAGLCPPAAGRELESLFIKHSTVPIHKVL